MENTQTNVKTTWVLDAAHSELLFKVKHLMIANVKGEFRKFNAEILGDDFTTSPVRVTVDTASVFTNNDDRDNHLRSADFLMRLITLKWFLKVLHSPPKVPEIMS